MSRNELKVDCMFPDQKKNFKVKFMEVVKVQSNDLMLANENCKERDFRYVKKETQT